MSRPLPPTPQQVREAIDQALYGGGFLDIWQHCYDRLEERGGGDDVDIRHCLADGVVNPVPEWSDKYQHWRWRVEGTDFEGDAMTAVAVVVTARYVSVVTMF